LVDLETDKVNVEISADQDGVLQEILKDEGANVSVGEVIGTLGAAATTAKPTAPTNGAAKAPAAEAAPPSPAPAAPADERDARATPVARRIAADQGVDIRTIAGSGPGGRVTKEDVASQASGQSSVADRAPTPAAAPSPTPAPAKAPQLPSDGVATAD